MANKLRAYNSKVLADHYAIMLQIQAKLEAILHSNSGISDLSQLPQSLLPTELLYNITLCYEVMYNALLDSSLLKDGHVKTQDTIH